MAHQRDPQQAHAAVGDAETAHGEAQEAPASGTAYTAQGEIPPVISEFGAQGPSASDRAFGVAKKGVKGPGGQLPHLDAIQRSFGDHDVSGVQAHVGGNAAASAQQLGAEAYAVGDTVGFQQQPTLHTAAHEAAHVVQQRQGVSFKGVDSPMASHEQHADQVADAVVAGKSAKPLLDSAPQAAGGAVQRKAGAQGAAADYTGADETERVRLALKAAGDAARTGVATIKKGDDKLNAYFAESGAKHINQHLDMAFGLTAGAPVDKKAYGAEAAAAHEAIDQFVTAAVSYLEEAELGAMMKRSDKLGTWGTGVKVKAHNKGFDKKDRNKAAMLALRSVRTHVDDRMDAYTNPNDLTFTAGFALEDLSYAYDLLASEPANPALAADVELTTRSLGRLYAVIQSLEKHGGSPVGGGWLSSIKLKANGLRNLAGLTPDGWIGDVVDGQAVAADTKPPKKEAARRELTQWNAAAHEIVDDVRRYNSNNWTAFYGATSQNPILGWDANVFDQTASNFVGNILTTLGENLIKKGSAAIAGALIGSAAGPAGTVIGFVIGLIIETVASVVYDYFTHDNSKEDRAAADGSKKTAKMTEAKNEQFNEAAVKGRAEQNAAHSAAVGELDSASSQAKVDAIGAEARAEKEKASGPKNHADRSLYKAMLTDWVKEHAGDEESANVDTSKAQWNDAAKEVTGKENLNNTRNLYAYQCRHEWKKAGFKGDQVDAIVNPMIQNPDEKRDQGKYVKFKGVVDAPTHIGYLNRTANRVSMGAYKVAPSEERMQQIEKNPGDVEVECVLDLTHADGTTYVNNWLYTIDPAWEGGFKSGFALSPD
ncbi:MAG TPA: DUF4157 domain-containing protein [Kofleriaceae bacterium]|nr:DUF4157 domain-containing protein [Kofleriaceae bacterium]